ncbi:Six-hairpin glycosidase [Rhizodiscina lignyota]|uniref:Six-hairpin glycosidase n=1 Tax=Rhizodiscina lignyota TaxID=1504668 RepID=A0A9P4IUG4_9PEZI|nr:Six-hairpin glycosidase [Rhizodiscina lignyota]
MLETNIYRGQKITLSPESPVVTLDYGTETGGFAHIDVDSLNGPTQIEFKFSEAFYGLNNPYSDGPWTFANGLSSTFSTETFNITKPGITTAYFIQGGFRWQTITLLPGSQSLTFRTVGVQSTVPKESPELLPAQFSASNELYGDIWKLGARCVQAACIPAYSAPSTWKVTSEGAYIVGQQPAVSSKSTDFNDLYELSFSTKIVRGGSGWSIGTTGSEFANGNYFVLTSDYPPSTFENTNRSLVPPNTLAFSYGWNLVNQTTLDTGPVIHRKISVDIHEGQWHRISTKMNNGSFSISIDGKEAATISLREYHQLYNPAPASVSGGPFGFGPFQDQIAYVKDVKVVASNGTTLYSNPMTSPDILFEYSVHELTDNVCLDGAKRDRLVWIGDFAHTARTLGTTTNRLYFIQGTVEFAFARQAPDGFVPISGAMGSRPAPGPVGGGAALTDYQIFFLNAAYAYYQYSGDLAWAKKYWPQMKRVVQGLYGFIDPSSGLMAGDGSYFIGPANGTAVTSLFTWSLHHMSEIATVLDDSAAASNFTAVADSLSKAVQSQLWSDSLGTFALALNNKTDFGVTGIALSILSGIANEAQAITSIQKALPKLYNKIGYNDQSNTDPSTHISPNTNGFLLEAIMLTASTYSHNDGILAAQLAEPAALLLDGMWRNMVVQDQYYSGATWEYMNANGTPGLDRYTSLSHPWGSAPSYVLPQYVLGLQATEPGWKKWTLRPFVWSFGLDWVKGKSETPYGSIVASWRVDGTRLEVIVSSPEETEGTIALPVSVSSYVLNGKSITATKTSVVNHNIFHIVSRMMYFEYVYRSRVRRKVKVR